MATINKENSSNAAALIIPDMYIHHMLSDRLSRKERDTLMKLAIQHGTDCVDDGYN